MKIINTVYAYGISQNPATKDYIIVLRENIRYWASGNEKINNFIRKRQLNYDNSGYLFEWIPYNQFKSIEKIDKDSFATIYSATWKDGPLYYNKLDKKSLRDSERKVALKCLNQNMVDEILKEV
jgi:hypothetical protein